MKTDIAARHQYLVDTSIFGGRNITEAATRAFRSDCQKHAQALADHREALSHQEIVSKNSKWFRKNGADLSPSDIAIDLLDGPQAIKEKTVRAAEIQVNARQNFIKRWISVGREGFGLGVAIGWLEVKRRLGQVSSEDTERTTKAAASFAEAVSNLSADKVASKALVSSWHNTLSILLERRRKSGSKFVELVCDDVSNALLYRFLEYRSCYGQISSKSASPLDAADNDGLIKANRRAIDAICKVIEEIDGSFYTLARLEMRQAMRGMSAEFEDQVVWALPRLFELAAKDAKKTVQFLNSLMTGQVNTADKDEPPAPIEQNAFWTRKRQEIVDRLVNRLSAMDEVEFSRTISTLYSTVTAAEKIVANEKAFQSLRNELNPERRPHVLVAGSHWRLGTLCDFREEIEADCHGRDRFLPKHRIHELRQVEISIAARENEIMKVTAQIEGLLSDVDAAKERSALIYRELDKIGNDLAKLSDNGKDLVEVPWSSHRPTTYISKIKDHVARQANSAESAYMAPKP